ncbi:uncharacterized protein LOC131675693 [Phymastichus coffea]|uniref:uncharacterized protein LOC131675693 n=1 Tax=Phymastichus coffea TaxID=108790 RepID=UPI00273B330C|nr:uncharacterized protein LOC131675693 [Phymastichus coffea]
MIAAFIKNHTRWDELIDEHAFASNTAVHEATRSGPAFLNYGRHPEPPSNARRTEERAAVEQLEAVARADWHSRMSKLDDFRANALGNSKTAQTRQEKYYNQKHRDIDYGVGDKVWARNRVLSSAAKAIAAKLCPKYAGPFVVTTRLGMNSYQLQTENGVDIGKVAVSDLKPCSDDEQFPIDETFDGGDASESETEKLLDDQAAEQSKANESAVAPSSSPSADHLIQLKKSQA